MASSLTTSKGCLNQPTATFLHKCDQKYSASAQRVLVAVGAGEWQSLENGRRWRMVGASLSGRLTCSVNPYIKTLRGGEIRLLTIRSQSNFTLENAYLRDNPYCVAMPDFERINTRQWQKKRKPSSLPMLSINPYRRSTTSALGVPVPLSTNSLKSKAPWNITAIRMARNTRSVRTAFLSSEMLGSAGPSYRPSLKLALFWRVCSL